MKTTDELQSVTEQAEELEAVLNGDKEIEEPPKTETMEVTFNSPEEEQEPWANAPWQMAEPVQYWATQRDCIICEEPFIISSQYDTRQICPDCIQKLRCLIKGVKL